MVFSSLEFIYLFLPPVLIGFLILRHFRWETGIIWWLTLASLAFYGWWKPIYLPLLLGSVVINYALHRVLLKVRDRFVLITGIVFNLVLIAVFKYADFVIGNVNALAGADVPFLNLALPLAISFFTFQQISFLIDTYRGDVSDCDFPRYMLFVVFFPQLIAGPIVMQRETIPQFKMKVFQNRLVLNLAVGATLFAIGLFKKIVLADGIAPYANTVFSLAETGTGVPMEAAWIGALAYTFQLYFDFSGYCDMALGLARMFGIRLPVNFNSPYKATSISDFWRRWHITLSHFLRDYLYILLGGNRSGAARQKANLMITMLLGGLWHGASWNFVFWGGLHGAYLVINHGWSQLVGKGYVPNVLPAPLAQFLSRALTLLAVVVAWVYFRAESFEGANNILVGMTGLSTVYEPKLWESVTLETAPIWAGLAMLSGIVFLLPNSIEFTERYNPVLRVKQFVAQRKSDGFLPLRWRPSASWAMALSMIGVVSMLQIYRLADLTEFIYFNF
ncbi:D-alanyl-lipoteichoic acid acyltransferase DltB (MBOAT superfamily) [Roseibium hamelinense]|uniref:Probable alginate O-acetylase AlgI n=1 Tax=Roseibium hamelinense TaxID=150831 RepID=A0A562SVE0_9HYPH|nr:MBOAT family O-acyltransferase [Roseibium hamelinense]MTI43067.1 MBOAT family protein [Roseibium hamelinense]TWI84630.1 D-alanyl-lipoteichoic acid acyltransferase DltB (MBOAT superfamily) [Roseibium hamelinense]